MDAWLVHEQSIRYYLLLASFGIVAVWEALAPRKRPAPSIAGRWRVNLGLLVLLSAVVALVFPMLSVGAAALARQAGVGLLNATPLPEPAKFAIALLALDASQYVLHLALHRVPWLWRLHRVHHSDPEFDCTTALRFHPFEALVTVALQVAFVVALGASPWAVLVYQVALGAVALFSHGSFALPARIDRVLRRFVVTPDMHRLHHSTRLAESNANFGSILPWWDRLFGTYCHAPTIPGAEIPIGLAEVRDERTGRLAWLLASPFLALHPGTPAGGTTKH